MKKLLTLTLSLLMVFSMCLTVSAEDISSGEALVDYLEVQEELYVDYGKADPVIIDLKNDITIENLSARYFDITVNLNGNALNITGSITINEGQKITINDNNDGGEVNIGNSIIDNGTFEVTGGTFNRDVSAYLGEGCSIVYEVGTGILGNYTVYKQGAYPTVDEDTVAAAAMNQEARTNLKGKTFVGNNSGDLKDIVVDSSTRFFLTSIFEGDMGQEEAALFGQELKNQNFYTDTTNLEYISLDIELKAYGDNGKIYSIYELINKNDNTYYEIPVTLYLSPETVEKLKGKDIKVVREHDSDETDENPGGFSLIEDVTLNVENNTLTFNTGKFSGYYIAYKTSSGSSSDSGSGSSSSTTTTTPTKTYDAKDKNKDGVVSCEEEMNSANWVWSTTKGACVYSVTNTSAK